MPWTDIDEDETLEEGDTVRTFYCIHAPNIPGDDILARFTVETAKLTGEINNNLECMETEVVDQRLERSSGVVVEGNECEFLYVTTLEVTKIHDDCPEEQRRAGVVSSAVILAISALVVLLGISLALWRMEKLFTGESAESANLLVWAALIAAGGYALKEVNTTFGKGQSG